MIPIKQNNGLAELHYNNIVTILNHHINRVLNDGGIRKRNPSRLLPLSPSLRRLLQCFINRPSTLKNLIVLDPENLEKYAESLKLTRPNFYQPIIGSYDYEIIYNIFVLSSYDSLNKYDFTSSIEIDCCPYCNRNYIYSVRKGKTIQPEIDHFYAKKYYPLLAVSFFNLIPACQSCNGFSAKSQTDVIGLNVKSPYLIKSTDFKFTFDIKSLYIARINPLVGKSNVEILFSKKIQDYCDLFNLEILYSKHSDHALELIVKKRIKYSNKYRAYLNSYIGLTCNKKEIDRMILGNYTLESEQYKRPLAKLYQDIAEQLQLI